MALLIANIEDPPTYDAQAFPDKTDIAAQQMQLQGSGVISGMTVTPSSLMTVSIAAGTYAYIGQYYSYAGGTVTLSAASATDRKDIISIPATGSPVATAGTACGTAGWTRNSLGLPPVKPAIPAASILLAEIYVANTTTNITTGNIYDKTCPLPASIIPITPLAPTAAVTAIPNTYTVCNPSTTFLVTLPISPRGGTVCGITVPSASGNTAYVTVAAGTGDLIDHPLSRIYQGQSVLLMYDANLQIWINVTQSLLQNNPAGRLSSTTQVVISGAWTQITGLTVMYAAGGMVGSSTSLTIGTAGKYSLKTGTSWQVSSGAPPSGLYQVAIYKNGSSWKIKADQWVSPSAYVGSLLVDEDLLAVGDVLTMYAYCSGTAGTSNLAVTSTFLTASLVST